MQPDPLAIGYCGRLMSFSSPCQQGVDMALTLPPLPYAYDAPLFNNAAQAYNHTHFWHWLKPNGGGAIPGKLEKALADSFGSVDEAKKQLVQGGVGQFGSGWTWFALKDGKIEVLKTPNGENPLIHSAIPLLGIDVWEHSYYIDYRNRRLDYLQAV